MITEYSDYSEEDARRAKEYKDWLERRPTCDWCMEPIEDDYAFEIDGQLICGDCIEDYLHEEHRVQVHEKYL